MMQRSARKLKQGGLSKEAARKTEFAPAKCCVLLALNSQQCANHCAGAAYSVPPLGLLGEGGRRNFADKRAALARIQPVL